MPAQLSKAVVLQRLSSGLPGGDPEVVFAQACQRAGVAPNKGSYHPAEVALVGKALMEIASEALSKIDLSQLGAIQPQEG